MYWFQWSKTSFHSSVHIISTAPPSVMQINWQLALSFAFQSIEDHLHYTLYESTVILGELSLLITYAMALVPMFKYVFIAPWANDNGDGNLTKVSLIYQEDSQIIEVEYWPLDHIYKFKNLCRVFWNDLYHPFLSKLIDKTTNSHGIAVFIVHFLRKIDGHRLMVWVFHWN